VVFALTLIGLVFALAGILCGVVAFLATLKAHDPDPLLRWWPRAVEHVRRAAVKISGWFGVTPPTRYIHVTDGIHANDEFGVGTVLRSGLPVPSDLPVEQQIRLLVQRIEDAEDAAKIDRERHAEELHALRADLTGRTDRLQESNNRILRDARDMVLGTIRLQILGLGLVGVGTALMTLPVLFSI
jgi:hypothetical protein